MTRVILLEVTERPPIQVYVTFNTLLISLYISFFVSPEFSVESLVLMNFKTIAFLSL